MAPTGWWLRSKARGSSRDMFGRALSPLVSVAPSPDPASWIRDRLLPMSRTTGTRVCSVVPDGFEAYARVLHPAFGPLPDRVPFTWSAAADRARCVLHAETQWESIVEALRESGWEPPWQEDPGLGWCPPEVMTPLCETLVGQTSTPDVVWYGMWVGYPDVLAVSKGAPHFELPGREYVLLKGPLQAAGEIIVSPAALRTSPSLWWPEDRAWCVATEIDFRWTYVGGTEECIVNLETESRLEVLRALPEHRGDLESDWPNEPRAL
jgi:hypothetical protein